MDFVPWGIIPRELRSSVMSTKFERGGDWVGGHDTFPCFGKDSGSDDWSVDEIEFGRWANSGLEKKRTQNFCGWFGDEF